MYHVDKVIREAGDILNDGIHMVYVNTKVNDGTAVAELMEIFKSSSAKENEKFPNVCRIIRDYKVGKGRDIMCTVVEEYGKEKMKLGDYKRLVRQIRRKLDVMSYEEMADMFDVTVSDVERIVDVIKDNPDTSNEDIASKLVEE